MLLLFWVVTAGCASPRPSPERVAELAQALARFPGVRSEEAEQAAHTAYACAAELRQQYRVVPPAVVHNVFVNFGWRERGLCYHWAEDLEARLQTLHLTTLRIRRGVAWGDTRDEHNCVVLTGQEQPFAEGLVLDGWRRSGGLFWTPVGKDSYPWEDLQEFTNTPPRLRVTRSPVTLESPPVDY